MGSRTPSTLRSLAGNKRGSKLKKIGSSIASGLQAGEETLSSGGASGATILSGVASSGGCAAGNGAIVFASAIGGAATILANSKPSAEIVFHTTKFADLLYNNLTKLAEGYKTQRQTVFSQLGKSPVEFPVNVVQSIVVDEVSDIVWGNIKSEFALNATAHQDRLAKFIITQIIGLAVDMIKQKIKGEKIDKEFFYKQAINTALEYCLDSFFQSSAENAELTNNPSISYCQLQPETHKVLETATKEVIKDIVDLIYDDIATRKDFPTKSKFNTLLKRSIKEKLKVEIEASEYEHNNKLSIQKIVIYHQETAPSEIQKNDFILSTKSKVDRKNIDERHRIRFKCESDYVEERLTPAHKDLLNIASTISKLEYLMRNEKDKEHIMPDGVVIYSHTIVAKEIEKIVNLLASFLLTYNPKIEIKQSEEIEFKPKEIKETADVIVLFSGGLDSLAGLEYAKKRYKNPKFVFVNNRINKVSRFVRALQHTFGLGDNLIIFQSQKGGKFLQQTRGFLFLTAAAIVADIFKAKKIIVAECGVTKYQPSISPSDEITKTTHPFMVKLSREIFEKFGIDVKIDFPFEGFTKAEIIAGHSSPLSLKNSHSCRSSNFSNEDKSECGYCFGCLLKHISLSYITGEKQNQFLIDPLTNKNNFKTKNLGHTIKLNTMRYESIFSLIGFSSSVLADCLSTSTKNYIAQYKTGDLFKRHAEDMIYGLIYMKNKGWIKNEKIIAILDKIEKANWYEADRIDSRKKEILDTKY